MKLQCRVAICFAPDHHEVQRPAFRLEYTSLQARLANGKMDLAVSATSPNGKWTAQGFLQLGPTGIKFGQFGPIDLFNPSVILFAQRNEGKQFTGGSPSATRRASRCLETIEANWVYFGSSMCKPRSSRSGSTTGNCRSSQPRFHGLSWRIHAVLNASVGTSRLGAAEHRRQFAATIHQSSVKH
jgi:hypothetical protein